MIFYEGTYPLGGACEIFMIEISWQDQMESQKTQLTELDDGSKEHNDDVTEEDRITER